MNLIYGNLPHTPPPEPKKRAEAFEIIVEFKMDRIPDIEDFKNCMQDAFISYSKKHPEELVEIEWVHLRPANRLNAERDDLERLVTW